MARHYSTNEFFRQMPVALLGRYFGQRGVLVDLDFSELSEAQPETLLEAWLAVDETQRHAMDAEFREIFELSCEKGFRAIIDEADWH